MMLDGFMLEQTVRRAEFFAAAMTAVTELRKSAKTRELADHLRDTLLAYRLDSLPVRPVEYDDNDPFAGVPIRWFKEDLAA